MIIIVIIVITITAAALEAMAAPDLAPFPVASSRVPHAETQAKYSLHYCHDNYDLLLVVHCTISYSIIIISIIISIYDCFVHVLCYS